MLSDWFSYHVETIGTGRLNKAEAFIAFGYFKTAFFIKTDSGRIICQYIEVYKIIVIFRSHPLYKFFACAHSTEVGKGAAGYKLDMTCLLGFCFYGKVFFADTTEVFGIRDNIA